MQNYLYLLPTFIDHFFQLVKNFVFQPAIGDSRKNLIMEAFSKMDKTEDGVITIEDLRGVYSVTQHPKYLSGESTENEILGKFLSNFESTPSPDGKVLVSNQYFI